MSTLFDFLGEKRISSLRVGAPSTHLLKKCGELIAKATLSLQNPDTYTAELFQYGPFEGALVFRKEVAKFLTEMYGDPVDHEDIWLNAGASQGLYFVAGFLFQPGDVVFVEEPSYFLGIRVLRDDLGMKVVGIPTDQDGIIVDELEKLIIEHSDKVRLPTDAKPFSAMVYCVPTFNNPTGSFLPAGRCKRLIKVLRKHNVLAVCDDVYNLLPFMEDKPPFISSPPQRLFAYDSKSDPGYSGNVISNGSFSKLLGPGLRIGWIEAPKRARSVLLKSGNLASGGSFNHYTSHIIAKALNMGLVKEHLIYARGVYYSQMNALCDSLDKYITKPFSYQRPKGGYFVWVAFPPQVDCDKLLAICREKYNVDFNHGSCCSSSGKFKHCMRLSFAHNECDVIEQCVRQIAAALTEMLGCQ